MNLKLVSILTSILSLASISYAQDEDRIDSFIWDIRNNLPKLIEKNGALNQTDISKYKGLFESGKKDYIFNIKFYLERDLINSYQPIDPNKPLPYEIRKDLAVFIERMYQAYLDGDQKAYDAAFFGVQNRVSKIEEYRALESATKGKIKTSPPERCPPPEIQPPPKKEVENAKPVTPKIEGEIATQLLYEAPSLNCESIGNGKDLADCMRSKANFTEKRIVIDPGHLGGHNTQDGREFEGFREGEGTFVTSNLLKLILTTCFGAANQNILLTRSDLFSIGEKKGLTKDNDELLSYRARYIASLQPDLFLSVHTNATAGAQQRVEVFIPRESNDPERFPEPSTGARDQTVVESNRFATDVLQSMSDEWKSTVAGGVSKGAAVGFDISSEQSFNRIENKDMRVFRHIIGKGIPCVLIEGFFHDNPVAIQHLNKSKTEIITTPTGDISYSPALRWYAQGLARGIARHFGCI